VPLLDAPPLGALGQLVALHGAWHARHWRFGLGFEAQLALEVGEFARGRGFGELWLTTLAGLDAARRLHETAGFGLEWEGANAGYGPPVMAPRSRMALR